MRRLTARLIRNVAGEKRMMNWDIGALAGAIQYRVVETDGPMQAILYENEPFLGKPTEVFAYMGVPESNGQLVPGMVCVHGGGGKGGWNAATPRLPWT